MAANILTAGSSAMAPKQARIGDPYVALPRRQWRLAGPSAVCDQQHRVTASPGGSHKPTEFASLGRVVPVWPMW
jgi:hypothetical protein